MMRHINSKTKNCEDSVKQESSVDLDSLCLKTAYKTYYMKIFKQRFQTRQSKLLFKEEKKAIRVQQKDKKALDVSESEEDSLSFAQASKFVQFGQPASDSDDDQSLNLDPKDIQEAIDLQKKMDQFMTSIIDISASKPEISAIQESYFEPTDISAIK